MAISRLPERSNFYKVLLAVSLDYPGYEFSISNARAICDSYPRAVLGLILCSLAKKRTIADNLQSTVLFESFLEKTDGRETST